METPVVLKDPTHFQNESCNLGGNAPSTLHSYSVNKKDCFKPGTVEKGDTDGIVATFNQTKKWTGSTKANFTQRFTCHLGCYWSWTAACWPRTHAQPSQRYAFTSVDMDSSPLYPPFQPPVLKIWLYGAGPNRRSVSPCTWLSNCTPGKHPSVESVASVLTCYKAKPLSTDGAGEEECDLWFGFSHGTSTNPAHWKKLGKAKMTYVSTNSLSICGVHT